MSKENPFIGRQSELAHLQQLFEQVATPGSGPRMATLVAHTGVGKTRLAHEFYRWLSNHPKWDSTEYWPDDLGRDKDTLRSNPELPADHVGTPRFIWWGMRAANNADRNHADEGAMSRAASALRYLRTIIKVVAGKMFVRAGYSMGGAHAEPAAVGPQAKAGADLLQGLVDDLNAKLGLARRRQSLQQRGYA